MMVLTIFRRHLGLLRNADGNVRRATAVVQWVLPILVGLVVYLADLRIDTTAATAVLTVAGLFAAFSFSLSIQMMSRAATLTDLQLERSKQVSRTADLSEMIAGSAAYTSLVALSTTALALGVILVPDGWAARLLVATTSMALTHLAVTAAVVVIEVFRVTVAHLRTARTGGGRGGNRAA